MIFIYGKTKKMTLLSCLVSQLIDLYMSLSLVSCPLLYESNFVIYFFKHQEFQLDAPTSQTCICCLFLLQAWMKFVSLCSEALFLFILIRTMSKDREKAKLELQFGEQFFFPLLTTNWKLSMLRRELEAAKELPLQISIHVA